MLKIQDSHGANAMQLRKPEEVLCSAVGEHAVGVGEPREHSNLAGILKPDACNAEPIFEKKNHTSIDSNWQNQQEQQQQKKKEAGYEITGRERLTGRHDCRMIRLLAVSQPRTPARERKPREARGAAAMEVGAGGVAVLGRL